MKSEGKQAKLLLKSVQTIDKIIEKCELGGLRIFLKSVEAVNALAERLKESDERNDSPKVPINIVVVAPELRNEVEIELQNNYSISPAMIGAIKHIDGVAHIERMES